MFNLEVFETADGRGKGVRTENAISKGAFICYYEGERFTKRRAHERINEGTTDSTYTFWMRPPPTRATICIDATHSKHLSRYFNHSRQHPNIEPMMIQTFTFGKLMWRIAFYALDDIPPGTELVFDYGDHDPQTEADNPWLKD